MQEQEQIIYPEVITGDLIKASEEFNEELNKSKEKDNPITLEIMQSRTLRKKFGIKLTTYKRETPKIGRNEKCPCGSGKKYKHCCL